MLGSDLIGASDSAWYALHVRSNFTQIAASCLQRKGFEEFTPLYERVRHWSDRTRRVEVPLFPGYVFCRFHVAQLVSVLRTPGVLSVVAFGNRAAPVDEREIADLQSIVRARAAMMPWPYLRIGQTVRLRSGPLRGLSGFLVEVKAGARIVVSVTLLHRSVAVLLERSDVEPVL